MPFRMSKHQRCARVALRTPLLSIGQHAYVRFATWETAHTGQLAYRASQKRERVSVTLTKRSKNVGLVNVTDASVFHHVISRFVHASNRAGGFSVSSLRLPVGEILSDLGLPSTAKRDVIDALRRITNTLVTVSRRSRPSYPSAARLIDITRDETGDFDLTLSAWLEDEIVAGQVCQAPSSSRSLDGIRQRLHGWMVSWVGREEEDGRVIWLHEILDRLGPLWENAGDPWVEVRAVVEANDLPDFHVGLTTDRGDPAIFMRPRRLRQTQKKVVPSGSALNEIGLEDD
jgi:hypothetical protein